MSDPTRLTGFLLVAGGALWLLIVTTELDRTILVPGVGVVFLGGSRVAGIRDIGIYLVPAALVMVGLLLALRPTRGRTEEGR